MRYFAFISYSSKDAEWGKWLQKRLEHYRLPTSLCKEHGWKRTPMAPVFFAPTDIQPGGLNEELQERLRASKYLVVICSPNSAKSEWVGTEINFFRYMGREEQIHFFCVGGIPYSGDPETECINRIVNTRYLSEIPNINKNIYHTSWMNKEYAYVQLVSKLLGLKFDDVWKLHKKELICKYIIRGVGIVILLTIVSVLILQK